MLSPRGLPLSQIPLDPVTSTGMTGIGYFSALEASGVNLDPALAGILHRYSSVTLPGRQYFPLVLPTAPLKKKERTVKNLRELASARGFDAPHFETAFLVALFSRYRETFYHRIGLDSLIIPGEPLSDPAQGGRKFVVLRMAEDRISRIEMAAIKEKAVLGEREGVLVNHD